MNNSYINQMKQCNKCKEIKNLDLFPNNKKTKDGKSSWCKKCVSNNTQKYILENKNTHQEKMNKWRKDNPQYMKQWLENNKKYHTHYYHNVLKNDELKSFIKSVRTLIYDSFKRGGNGRFQKLISTEEILGCSIPEFIFYLQSKFKPGMTLENHGQGKGKWHVDHIKPISLAKTKDEVFKLSHYSNFQPLWGEENIRKKNRIL